MGKTTTQFIADLQSEYGKGKEITLQELELILRKIDGGRASDLWLIAETPVTMNKGGRQMDNYLYPEKVMTLAKYDATVNFNYTNAVNNQLGREDREKDFEAEKNWHTSSFDQFNGCVKEHAEKGGAYIAIKQNNYEKITYLVNDVEPTVEQLETIKKYKKGYVAPKNQGTEKPIIYRTIMLSNIRMIKMYGELYSILPN